MAKKQEVASAERLAAEGGIASDESAVAKPEIGADEDAAEEPEKESDESAKAKGDGGETGCPVEMGYDDDQRCGRKLYAAPAGVDEQPVCLMHSKDPNKQSGELFDAFWQKFERRMKKAGENEAHFERFVFPHANFTKREFRAICRFEGADFTQDAHFNEATFTQNAFFGEANFKRRAIFHKATFNQDANFSSATFTQDAVFWSSTFTRNAELGGAIFTQNADFHEATFKQRTSFFKVIFTQNADFRGVTFMQKAVFGGATFTQEAVFSGAIFTQEVYFTAATFKQYTYFNESTFTQDADFRGTSFMRYAGFLGTKFYGTVDWRWCRFLEQANFRHIIFEPKGPTVPSTVFSLAKFGKPEEVVFEDVDLSRALFLNCDMSAVWFTSSVKWARRKGHRGLAVFEEEILLDPELSQIEEEYGEFDHGAVEQIYHQLQKNYDSRLDYRKANEFHFGEMEMKRLAGPTSGPLLWLRRWWHPRLSFVAWYKYASDYGNSYRKPLLWLLGTLLAAALLFPITGLELKQAISVSSASVTYSSVWDKNNSWTNNFWTEAKLIGKSGITAIDTATFQRTPEYTPVYPRGRVLAIVETLLTSSLFALFLLAIRRQFRR
jgi:uncharacterized protein YjbI with pentapeptide repeats